MNALAAAAATSAVGIELAAIRAPVSQRRADRSRMRVVTLASGVTVVDDSYNANPASVAAALRGLAAAPATRRIAVLGDMLELGPASAAQHRAVGTLAGTLGLAAALPAWRLRGRDRRRCRGRHARPRPSMWRANHAAIAAALVADARRGDWVLVKGSRGQRMEEVVRLLGAA